MDSRITEDFKKHMVGKRSLSPKTVDVYLNRVKNFLKHTGRELNPEKLTENEVITAFSEFKIDYKMAVNSRRLIKIAVESFYDWFSARAGIPNPTAGMAPIKQYYSNPRFVNPEEVEILLRAADEHKDRDFARRNCAVIALLADTGIRIAEFEMLNAGDVQPVYKGKSLVNFELHVSGVKGGHARVVPFARLVEGDLCAEFFARYFIWLTLEKHQPKNQPLFFRLQNNFYKEDLKKRLWRGAVENVLRYTRKAAGLDKNVSPHDFRHYYGTYSYINGMDLRTLQSFMGHARLDTTIRYIHVAERIKGSALAHSATVGLKAPQQVTGFAKLLQDLGKRG